MADVNETACQEKSNCSSLISENGIQSEDITTGQMPMTKAMAVVNERGGAVMWETNGDGVFAHFFARIESTDVWSKIFICSSWFYDLFRPQKKCFFGIGNLIWLRCDNDFWLFKIKIKIKKWKKTLMY